MMLSLQNSASIQQRTSRLKFGLPAAYPGPRTPLHLGQVESYVCVSLLIPGQLRFDVPIHVHQASLVIHLHVDSVAFFL